MIERDSPTATTWTALQQLKSNNVGDKVDVVADVASEVGCGLGETEAVGDDVVVFGVGTAVAVGAGVIVGSRLEVGRNVGVDVKDQLNAGSVAL